MLEGIRDDFIDDQGAGYGCADIEEDILDIDAQGNPVFVYTV